MSPITAGLLSYWNTSGNFFDVISSIAVILIFLLITISSTGRNRNGN